MTGWEWWAGDIDEDDYGLEGGIPTKDEVIRRVSRYMKPGDRFRVIEARSSADRRYEGSDFVPFLRTRNKEIVTVGPVAIDAAEARAMA
jgi:hypothetical protein